MSASFSRGSEQYARAGISPVRLSPLALLLLALLPYAAVACDGADEQAAVDFFASIDTDGDRRISAAELRAAAVARGIELTDEQVQAFLAADADGDGVDFEEFLDSLDETQLGKESIDSGLTQVGAISYDLQKYIDEHCPGCLT